LGAETRSRNREHAVALDQPAYRLERLGFRSLRVVADQINRQPADAALGIDLLDRDFHRDFRGLAPLGALAGKRDLAADLHVAAGELGALPLRGGHRHGQGRGSGEPSSERSCTYHRSLPWKLLFIRCTASVFRWRASYRLPGRLRSSFTTYAA